MEFFKVINSRRSIRRFQCEEVELAVLQKIVAAGAEAPSGCNLHLKQFIIVDDPAVVDKLRRFSKALHEALAVIAIIVEPKSSDYGEFWIQDASAAMENMLLAAVALGYGGCWVEGAVRSNEQEIAAVLNVPANLRPWSLMPVGKPSQELHRPTKPAWQEITHYNRYGQTDR